MQQRSEYNESTDGRKFPEVSGILETKKWISGKQSRHGIACVNTSGDLEIVKYNFEAGSGRKKRRIIIF